jgi:hypothetical protein
MRESKKGRAGVVDTDPNPPKIESSSSDITVGGQSAGAQAAPATVQTLGLTDFDLAGLKLSQDYGRLAAVKKRIITVPMRRPNKQEYFRVHPDPDWSFATMLLEDKEDRQTYVVAKPLWADYDAELRIVQIFTAVSRQGVIFLLPVPLPGSDGKLNPWHRSLMDAVQLARDQWIRINANMELGGYDCLIPEGDIPDPVWPDIPFAELLKIAFRDRYITTNDHPVLRKIRGAA